MKLGNDLIIEQKHKIEKQQKEKGFIWSSNLDHNEFIKSKYTQICLNIYKNR